MILDEEEYLAHYGVKGMRWGVRKQEDGTSHRERKAQKFDAKAEKYQTKIDYIESHKSKNFFVRDQQLRTRNDLRDLKAKAEKDAKAVREGHLTSNQKKALVAAALVTAALAAYGMHNMKESGELTRKMQQGEAFIQGRKLTPWKRNPLLASKDLDEAGIFEHVVKDINPNYGLPGTKRNCRRCTFAYEMRRRGFDVTSTRTKTGRGQHQGGLYNATNPGKKRIGPGIKTVSRRVERDIADAKSGKIKDRSFLKYIESGIGRDPIKELLPDGSPDIYAALSKQPDGARGELMTLWNSGGGHSMAWEIIHGRPVIFDTQTQKVYKNGDFPLIPVKRASLTRLDNIPLSEDFLMRWVKNR